MRIPAQICGTGASLHNGSLAAEYWQIEGEKLDSEQVRSSIARRLGLDVGGLLPADRNVEDVVEMMLNGTANYAQVLNAERLFGWHAALFPTGRSGMRKIIVGNWRDDRKGPMQVVSGAIGKERIYFEAPPAKHVPDEMGKFLAWFAAPGDLDPLLIAGLAHLWFITIHPFCIFRPNLNAHSGSI